MVVMGKVVAAHGILGWVKVQTFTEYLDSLNDYDHWWLGNERQPWREVELAECTVHGKILVARLAGCMDRNAAERLKGLLVAVPRSELPEAEEDEVYWSDLIGCKVVNLAGEPLGVVDTLLETGANDVLVVKRDTGEILIPYIGQVVKQADVANKTITVDWQADYLA